jgi:hypothetical protein
MAIPVSVLARDISSFVKDRGVRSMSTIGLFHPRAVWMIASYCEAAFTKIIRDVEIDRPGVVGLLTRLRLRLSVDF